ncbi:ImpB/MucB/SamB family protein [Streptococcus sp. DD13]|nr:ImpB/MucB/SamB family protein [Streptococcus sp. DD13]
MDESSVHSTYHPKSQGIGNSQILPRDYINQREIEIVLAEMAEQVAVRLRKRKKKARGVGLYIRFSRSEQAHHLHRHQKIEATNQTKTLIKTILTLFRNSYQGQAVRQIAIQYDSLVEDAIQEFTLFDDVDQLQKEEQIQQSIDRIREKFGFLSVQKATILTNGSRTIARSKLVGGHSVGGLDGLS